MGEADPHAEQREQLVILKAELMRRVDALDQDLRHALPMDSEEQATALENRDVQLALDAEARTELVDIERALSRMDDGSYGVCIDCGSDIGAPRLDAQPFASRCITCAQAAD